MESDEVMAALRAAAAPASGGASREELAAALSRVEAPDPLAEVVYPGDLAGDAKAELDALQVAFRDRMKGEADRFQQATDSEFWVALCFRDRAAKDKFLRVAELVALGDKYLDGHQVARVLGIELEE